MARQKMFLGTVTDGATGSEPQGKYFMARATVNAFQQVTVIYGASRCTAPIIECIPLEGGVGFIFSLYYGSRFTPRRKRRGFALPNPCTTGFRHAVIVEKQGIWA